jgi:hypothetical protein
MKDSHTPTTYQIKVQGELDASWSDCFGLTVQFDGDTTTLTGPVLDQAALRGIVCRLWDFNMTLLALQRVETRDELTPTHKGDHNECNSSHQNQ